MLTIGLTLNVCLCCWLIFVVWRQGGLEGDLPAGVSLGRRHLARGPPWPPGNFVAATGGLEGDLPAGVSLGRRHLARGPPWGGLEALPRAVHYPLTCPASRRYPSR
jgi:hypothetical protein